MESILYYKRFATGTTDVGVDKKGMINHLVIESGAILTIKKDVTFYRGATIHIKNGGRLIVDTASLTDATVLFDKGGDLKLINGGKIIPVKGKSFSVPQGATMRVEEGTLL